MQRPKLLDEALKNDDINSRFSNFKWTPMMSDWKRLKEHFVNLYGDNTILLYQVGTFYETYFHDAYIASKVLNLSYTSKSSKDPYSANLCGCPIMVGTQKAHTLLEHGFNVIMVSELGVAGTEGFKREVTSIFTPGTDLYAPHAKENYYVMGIYKSFDRYGISALDLTINDFKFIELDINDKLKLKNTLITYQPKEIIGNQEAIEDSFLTKLLSEGFYPKILSYDCKLNYGELIESQLKVAPRSIFDKNENNALVSSANVLKYIKDIQQAELEFINKLTRVNLEDFILLDDTTIKNLEIYRNNSGSVMHSLTNTLDETVTPFGARMLRKLIIKPLSNITKIKERLNTVEELYLNQNLNNILIENLAKLNDIERIASRIGTTKCTPGDLNQLKESLKVLPIIKEALKGSSTGFLKNIHQNLDLLEDLIQRIEFVLSDSASISTKDGFLINKGIDKRLDELIMLTEEKEVWMKQQEEKLIQETGIDSLKITENNLGIYIEIKRVKSKNNDATDDTVSDKAMDKTEHTHETYNIPKTWELARGLKSADRYINDDLKKFFIKSLTAMTERCQLEYDLFQNLRIEVAQFINAIQKNSKVLAHLDVFTNFAKISKYYNYVKPIVNTTNNIIIKKGRHPVIEKLTEFIDNETELNETSFHLITGINSGGKSTYIRQVSLIVLLTQIGCFVPAESAQIGIVDGIYTRVGSTDNLVKKQSTFMNEMIELSYILNNATNKSLVILDEVGSSTSFQDGLSIAQSISEYFIENRIRVLFATHYHELVDIINKYPNAKNYFVDFEIVNGKFKISHKIISGASQRSYGIEVAEHLGLKKEIIAKAKEIRQNLFNY